MTAPELDGASIATSAIVCDLGATKIRVGLIDRDAQEFSEESTPQDRDAILCCIEQLVASLQAKYRFITSYLIVGCPGLLDEAGYVHYALYINLSSTDLKKELERRLNLSVIVLNDAKLQASGLLSEFNDFAYFSLGSGVGGATAINRKLVLGERGFAGELGHFALRGVNQRCKCGKVGCLDTLAGGFSIANRHGESWWIRSKSTQRSQIVQMAGSACGLAIATLVQILNPPVFVLCGHLANEVDFISAVHTQLKVEAWSNIPRIVFRSDGWSLALRGARHVLNRTGDDA